MISEHMTFQDFFGAEATETLYFHLTTTETIEYEPEIKVRLNKFKARVEGRTSEEPNEDDMRALLEIVKWIMELSYGERSEDGRRFVKTPQVWREFTQTAAYDAFLMSLFTNQNRLWAWLAGIFPKEVAEAMPDMPVTPAPTLPTPSTVVQPEKIYTGENVEPTLAHVTEEVPAWMRENRDPTKDEYAKLNEAGKLQAFQMKMQRDK